MCRSILEHPPAGLRCEKNEHLSPEAREAKRLLRNERERELYRLRKNRAALETPVTEVSVPKLTAGQEQGKNLLTRLSKSENELGAFALTDRDVSTPEQRTQLAALLAGEQPTTAYTPVKEEHLQFNFDNNTVNDVHYITLQDGTKGYFKSYTAAVEADSGGATLDYGNTYLGASLNEVAAYRLSQLLGDGYNTLVPETVFREYGGDLGTFQVEAPGQTFQQLALGAEEMDVDVLHKAAIFDFISGAQDRHTGNYLVDTSVKPYRLSLIDNGFSFARPGSFHCPNSIRSAHERRNGKKYIISEEDRKTFQELHDSPDLKGLAELLEPSQVDTCRDRLNRLLTADQINATYLDTGEMDV